MNAVHILVAILLALAGLLSLITILVGSFMRRDDVVKGSALVLAGSVLGLFMLMAVMPGAFDS